MVNQSLVFLIKSIYHQQFQRNPLFPPSWMKIRYFQPTLLSVVGKGNQLYQIFNYGVGVVAAARDGLFNFLEAKDRRERI